MTVRMTPEPLDLVDLHPATRPTDYDVDLAARAVRVHCEMTWPRGSRCLNCGALHPCRWQRWAREVLARAGWHQADIDALDTRSGPWS